MFFHERTRLAAAALAVSVCGLLLRGSPSPGFAEDDTVHASPPTAGGLPDRPHGHPIALLETCPNEDPAYGQIRSDFTIRRNGVVVGAVPCSGPIGELPLAQYTDEVIVLQGLRLIYYMDRGQSGHLPWTTGTLYDWMKGQVRGIDINPSGHYCCEGYDGESYLVIAPSDDFNRDFDRGWKGISGNIGLYAHEARHADGFPHVSECGILFGCDQTYDESDLSPYGIQRWLDAAWLEGTLYVGFSCVSEIAADVASWHLTSANGFRDRFVDQLPPEVSLPADPGGPCRMGDVDCSVGTSSVDAALVLQLAASIVADLPCLQYADVNLDGERNAIDAALVLQRVAGLIEELPA